MKSIDDIASDINKYVVQTAKLELTCMHLNLKLVASPLYNFRDALTHYIRFYEAKTYLDKVSQETSIDEHLSRGLKDTCVFIIDEMKNKILDALKDANIKFKETIIRKELHIYKEQEIEIRKCTKMKNIDSLSLFIDNLINLIKNTETNFQKNSVCFKVNPRKKLP